MSAPLRTSGRMSRADAQAILTAIRATLPEFSTPDASPETLQEVADISAAHGILQEDLDRGYPHSAALIRDLRTCVAALQAARLANCLNQPARVTAAAVVTLYGIFGNTVEAAAAIAARQLDCDVRLQDSSHVRTATLTGTRYIFTSRTP
jgi:hypothetical protein